MRFSFFLALFLSAIRFANGVEEKTIWTSNEGQKLVAQGVSWSRDGIWVKRDKSQEKILLLYAKTSPVDINWAFSNLPFEPNDNVRLRAKTISVNGDNLTRETGEYVISISGAFSYNGYHFNGTGIITPIKEKYRISSRSLEIELGSVSGNGDAGVECYFIKGQGSEKKIFHAECGVVTFEKTGSTFHASSPAVENYGGWVVVLRSVGTGEILAMTSSLRFLEDFVSAQLPKKANITFDKNALQKEILASIPASPSQNSTPTTASPVSRDEMVNTTWEFRNKKGPLGIITFLPNGNIQSETYKGATWSRVNDDTILFKYGQSPDAEFVMFKFIDKDKNKMEGMQSKLNTPRFLVKKG